ncbi:DsbA family protein [Candidatus Woesearchaeota archaeon]|jgi:protein-disulfide isomerase|nr:DsbA family protein [Candidatus Woesearchaeota archaeon]MBT4110426.1 DsbA family protein [Candidatus Woesearchaeota archaeon]MBT4336050.1 DsbA family protein [Candidatus Woesearchaeota archaeon]MBT4468971.1 DsbA family protein [Candidatus Woesearchaeota archaeon]MBT6744710.1 DsbA family protein [Candidatus Woesearchaeota archaeon]
MTHYEKEHEEKKPEHHAHKEHTAHKEAHVENKQEHKKVKDSCCGTKLNSFQKFLAVAVVIQVLLLLFVAVKISALSGVAVENNEVVDVPSQAAVPSNNNAPAVDMATYIDDDSIKGDKDAPVTIVEFSDYECPFCTKFYDQSLQQIEKNYIDTGKVKFIYRDFPLSFHQNAQKAAEAAEVAGELGGDEKYFEMHDLLFEKGVAGGVASFKQYAREIGLDGGKFDKMLDSGEMAKEVQDDFIAGQQLGVSGTPAFFINGNLVSGAQPFSVFEQVIEAELSK